MVRCAHAEVKGKGWFVMNSAFRDLLADWGVLAMSGVAMLEMGTGQDDCAETQPFES